MPCNRLCSGLQPHWLSFKLLNLLWFPSLTALHQDSTISHQTSLQTSSLPAMDWVFVSVGPSCRFMCGGLNLRVMVLEVGPLGRNWIWLRSLVGRAPLMSSCSSAFSLCHREHSCQKPGSQPPPGTSELTLDLTSTTVRNKCCLSHPVDGILDIAAQTNKDTFSEFPSQTSLTFPLSCAQSFSVYFSNRSICGSCYIIYVCEEV